jgi:hypothetical protein
LLSNSPRTATARQQQPGGAHDEHGGAHEDEAPAAAAVGGSAKLMPLQVQVKRRETERQAEMRLHSHAYLKQLEVGLDTTFLHNVTLQSKHGSIDDSQYGNQSDTRE